ncbi:hypothetical protein HBH47_166270 [Parastagonospora nodorum]|nr:hypothetical protein HBH47_166270 [Parastagonospora nodorum]
MVEMDTTPVQTSTADTSAAVSANEKPPLAVAPACPPHPLGAFVPGYPKIAARMSLLPETGMFRRFGALNARNLLYLQGDLARIEEDLVKLEWEDSQSAKGEKQYYSHSSKLLGNASVLRDGDVKQRELVEKMRDTLHLYNHAIIQQRAILQMEMPDSVDVRNMQCFYDSAMMNHGNTLIGADRDIWGTVLEENSHSQELIVLKPREGTDTFSRKLSELAIPLFESLAPARFKKPNPRVGTLTVREDRVFRITLWTTCIVASMMRVLSIVVLTRLKEANERLGVIAGFNALLSVCLLWFTDAKRTDIFAVTAAFAAVQVVFVGQALDDGPKTVTVTNPGNFGGLCSCP